MAHENELKKQRVAELWPGMGLWKVHIDVLKEQDKNARVMSPEKFDRLKENIKKDKRLESLPLAFIDNGRPEDEHFYILSGHHRTRAARSAGIEEVFVMVIEDGLTRDQVIAKQLAHNALNGYDDPMLLAELYQEMKDVNAKIESGISNAEIEMEFPAISSDDLTFDFDYELFNILFLPKQKEKFDDILGQLEPSAEVYIADKADFERMTELMRTLSKKENIRNTSALFARMLDIVGEHLKEKKKNGNKQNENNRPIRGGEEENSVSGESVEGDLQG